LIYVSITTFAFQVTASSFRFLAIEARVNAIISHIISVIA